MNPRRAVVAGIDLGGTNTVFGLIDGAGRCHATGRLATDSHQELSVYLQRLAAAIRHCLADRPDLRLQGIGIGAPNGNYTRGTIEHPPNLHWKGIVPFVAEFKKHVPLPMALTNDANAAALGEMRFGAARDLTDFLVITLGTGLGSGIVSHGRLVYGATGFAGELGHTIAVRNGRRCGCGRRGCLETYASATGLRRTFLELLSRTDTASDLRAAAPADITAAAIARAARDGDAVAIRAFRRTGEILGRQLADSVAHTSPAAIFLLGGLAQAGELIFAPTRRSLAKNLLPVFQGTVDIRPSGLPPESAAILGAAALIWEELDR
ncbi:MAG: ROK family protein [Acidobacteria bacterium]|nr:ROK family protein [Acidobacteriota bacterium]